MSTLQEWSLDWPHYQSYFMPRLKHGAKNLSDEKRAALAVTRDGVVIENTRGSGISTEPVMGVNEAELWDVVSATLGSERSLFKQSSDWVGQLGLKSKPHFLIDTFLGKWNQIFPNEYALVIRLRGVKPGTDRSDAIWIRVKQAQVVAIERLSQISEDPKALQEQLQAISEKEKVAVQGLLMNEADWLQLGIQGQAWKKMAALFKNDQAQLVPFRWRVALWVGLRGLTTG